jgi:hypothetical protein
VKWLLLFRPAAIAPQITGEDDLIRPIAILALLTVLTAYLGDQVSSQWWAASGYAEPPNIAWANYLNVIVAPFIPAAQALALDLVARKLFGPQGGFRRLTRLFYYVTIGTTLVMILLLSATLLIEADVTNVRQPLSAANILLAICGAVFGIYAGFVGLYLVKSSYSIGYGTALLIAIIGHFALSVVVGVPGLMILTRFGILGAH